MIRNSVREGEQRHQRSHQVYDCSRDGWHQRQVKTISLAHDASWSRLSMILNLYMPHIESFQIRINLFAKILFRSSRVIFTLTVFMTNSNFSGRDTWFTILDARWWKYRSTALHHQNMYLRVPNLHFVKFEIFSSDICEKKEARHKYCYYSLSKPQALI
jgi:hypothetical protein